MRKTIYVTWIIRPTEFCRSIGYKTKHYAVKCDNENQAYEVISDVNAIDGVSYLRMNKCGRINKDAKVMLYGSDIIHNL